MKIIYTLALAALVSAPALAAEVRDARIEGDTLIVDVVHGGGCGTHKYDLELRGCAESMPVQCQANLKHTSNDNCEALLHREAKFSLRKLGIKGDYYSNGSLTINGSNRSRATVTLPAFGEDPAPRPARGGRNVECVTHTGSILIIDEARKEISLETTSGETKTYRITGTDMRVLESMPPQYQSFYKMDDGRQVVTIFREGQKTGSGNFIRIGGEYSPEFKSCRK